MKHLADDDPGELQTQEETTYGHPDPNDDRCKDYDPDPYRPPPPRCSAYVHYAPCVLAVGKERRDIRPWWQRLIG